METTQSLPSTMSVEDLMGLSIKQVVGAKTAHTHRLLLEMKEFIESNPVIQVTPS